MIRVLVVASMPALRVGLRGLLGSDAAIDVVGEAGGLAELREPLDGVDVVVAVGEAGIDSGPAELLELGGDLPALLMLSDDPASARSAPLLAQRAGGILPLEATAEELAAAVRAVYVGLSVAAPALLAPLLAGRLGAGERPLPPPAEPLTSRELEVLELLAQGLANKQIAAALHISEHTVKFHVSAIYAKLGATNRTEAVRLGAARGLIVL